MKRIIAFVFLFGLAFFGKAAEGARADARTSCESDIDVAHFTMAGGNVEKQQGNSACDSVAKTDGITAERLDRAVAYMLAQNPPLMLHGSLYGDCPEYRIPGTEVWVFCLGFWSNCFDSYSALFYNNDTKCRNNDTKCREISIRPAGTPSGHGFGVRWSENGDVVIHVFTNSWTITEAPEDMKRRVELVLEHCDKPFNLQPDPEIPETGNQFHDFIARKVIATRKKLGYTFGSTNRCEMAWTVPNRFTVDGEIYSAIPYDNIRPDFMEVSVRDAALNKVAKVVICKYDSAFAAGFSFCFEFGNLYDFGDLANLLGYKGVAIKAEADGDFFFAEPQLAVHSCADSPYLYVVWKNLYVVGHGKQMTREIIKALLLAGVASRHGVGRSDSQW